MTKPFHPFTPEHYIALSIGLAIGVVLICMGRRGDDSQKWARRILIFFNLSAFPLSQVAWLSLDQPKSIDNLVPLHLCDIAAFIAGFALITKRPLLCLLTYFWGLAATLQALITPAITVGFPHPPFIVFFIHHFAIVIAALYLPLVDHWRPQTSWWKSAIQANAWILLYLAIAMAANALLGSNFAFAARPPDNPSLIDHLGPWPWYLVAMQSIALVLFFLLALPFKKQASK